MKYITVLLNDIYLNVYTQHACYPILADIYSGRVNTWNPSYTKTPHILSPGVCHFVVETCADGRSWKNVK